MRDSWAGQRCALDAGCAFALQNFGGQKEITVTYLSGAFIFTTRRASKHRRHCPRHFGESYEKAVRAKGRVSVRPVGGEEKGTAASVGSSPRVKMVGGMKEGSNLEVQAD